MTWTTYCWKHEALEKVEEVTEVHSFMVERQGIMWPERTGQSARDVRAVTDAGCKVHFIGGTQWN